MLKPIAFVSHTFGKFMKIVLLLGKWLRQEIGCILTSGHFLYLSIISANDISDNVVSSEYVFGPLMRPWFLSLCYGSIVVTIQKYRMNNARYHS